jgi:hypothetical protein
MATVTIKCGNIERKFSKLSAHDVKRLRGQHGIKVLSVVWCLFETPIIV